MGEPVLPRLTTTLSGVRMRTLERVLSSSLPQIVGLSLRAAPCGSATETSVNSTPTFTCSCAVQVSVCVCVRMCAHAGCCLQCFERWLSARVSLQLCWLRADGTHNLVSHSPVGVSLQCVLLCGAWVFRQRGRRRQCGLLFMNERPSAAVTSLIPCFFLFLRGASHSPLHSAEIQCKCNHIKRRVSHLEN